jgi:uncharacterized protein
LSIAEANSAPVVVWRFSDGRRGHDNQSLGLIEALSELVPVVRHELSVEARLSGCIDFLLRRFPAGQSLPDPQLLIGAGHATHLPMLAARRARGGRAIVLMNPSLPRRCFDLCIVPRHDGVPPGPGVLTTDGAVNRIRPATSRDSRRALILVGGPSPHYSWDDAVTQRQIGELVATAPQLRWQIADSRRTPPTFLAGLKSVLAGYPDVTCVHCDAVDGEWLAREMPQCAMIWVTADSVSMLYEALSTGALVGLLPVAARGQTRVSTGVAELQRRGMLIELDAWRTNPQVMATGTALGEAQRCARYIIENLLSAATTG